MIQSIELTKLKKTIEQHDSVKLTCLLEENDYTYAILYRNKSQTHLTPFMLAAIVDNPEAISLMHKKVYQLNGVSNEGKTAVGYACKYGHPKSLQALIDIGANLDCHSHSSFNKPIFDCHVSCLPLLIKHNVDIHSMSNDDSTGITPLMQAVKDHDPSVAKLFLDAGVDIQAKDNMNRNVMYWAALSNSLPCVPILLEHGADYSTVKLAFENEKDSRLSDFFSIIQAHEEQNQLNAHIQSNLIDHKTRLSF